MSTSNNKIVLIGAGNVGHHLGHRLHEKGFEVMQVFSRKITKARKLAKAIHSSPFQDFEKMSTKADLYIIAVHDDAIESVAKKMGPHIDNALVVHTSGSVSSKVLKPHFKNYGCFYPLQTFSIDKKADFETLPICIYSPQKRNRVRLKKIASIICPNIFEIDDHQKSILHVAAVFVNNFTNHLYHIGKEIAADAKVDFDILKPLILETAKKVQDRSPNAMQTGPARRGDAITIAKHLKYLKYLESKKEWALLYELISKGIEKEF